MKRNFYSLFVLGMLSAISFSSHAKTNTDNITSACSNLEVKVWNGVTTQDKHTFDFRMFQFMNVPVSCLNSLTSPAVINVNHKKFSDVVFNDKESTYRWNKEWALTKHLELVYSEDKSKVSFSLPSIDVNSSVVSVDLNGNKFNVTKIKKYEPLKIKLPEVSVKVSQDEKSIQACTAFYPKFKEYLKINFDLNTSSGYKNEQVFCAEHNKNSLCCSANIPEGTKKYGVVRWRGDENSLSFQEKATTIGEIK